MGQRTTQFLNSRMMKAGSMVLMCCQCQ